MVLSKNAGITAKPSTPHTGTGPITGKKQTATVASRETGPLKGPAPKSNLDRGSPPAGPGKQGPADANLSLTWGASVPILTKAQMRSVAK